MDDQTHNQQTQLHSDDRALMMMIIIMIMYQVIKKNNEIIPRNSTLRRFCRVRQEHRLLTKPVRGAARMVVKAMYVRLDGFN